MPNHVTNVVKIIGDKLEIRSVLDSISGIDDYGEVADIDFNKIIPMPESLNIECSSVIKRCVDITLSLVNMKVVNKDVGFQIQSEFADVIKELNAGGFSRYDFNLSPEQINTYTEQILSYGKKDLSCSDDIVKLGMQAINNILQYGHRDWCSWAIANWETKWNAYNIRSDSNTIVFDTAWSAPISIFEKLVEMFPKVNFEIEWADEDMGVNTGYFNSDGGNVIDYGYFDNCSTEAYQAYLNCKGHSNCLYRDEDGDLCRRDCDTCGLCK